MLATADRFDIPNALRMEEGPGGLRRAVISTGAAEAVIYLHGAHVAEWTPRGQRPVLYLSSKSLFESGKAIRGGVPVIFPWFGPRANGQNGPMHGFARTMSWEIAETKLLDDGRVRVVLELAPDDSTRSLGYDAFHLRYQVTVGETLEMELETVNDGTATFSFEEALHTYFAIGDIHRVSVSGLEGTAYIDKTDAFKRKVQGQEPMRIAKETDQVYLGTKATCVIHDPVRNRSIAVEKSGSETTVVWNPWIEKTRTLSDMAEDDWQQMLCVETANAGDQAVHLPPGKSHKMTARIHVAVNG
jgi:glucose-6-phosphate 1-epimerase